MTRPRLWGDFNGRFGDHLCLSHNDTCKNQAGEEVPLMEGMQVTVFDEDADDDGAPAYLIATGKVVVSPDWLQCKGSRWSLSIDAEGCRHIAKDAWPEG